jgi:aspartate kinase/aspartokinase/homoserine dehydrogenase 1
VVLLNDDSITVHKFGGSCLRDNSDLDQIAKIVQNFPGRPVIVVSALWGTTDRLMRAANEPKYATRLVDDLRRQHIRFAYNIENSEFSHMFDSVLSGIEKSLGEISKKNEDINHVNTLLAAGERLSALVVSCHLQNLGINAHPVGSEDIGLHLDGIGNALSVDIEYSKQNLDYQSLNDIPVITGWFGEGKDGNIALLGRGGSDHSATAIARILDAEKVILWKDIEGVLAVNPRWGIETEPISYLGYGEARELTRMDAPIIHSSTMEPIQSTGIPIEIRHLYSNQSGLAPTTIGPDIVNQNYIKAIGCLRSVSKIEIDTKGIDSSKSVGELLIQLNQKDITCWSLNYLPSKVELVISQNKFNHAKEIIYSIFEKMKSNDYPALISLIGNLELEEFEFSLLSKMKLNQELSVLSKTPHSIQLLCKNDNIKSILEELSKSVKSKQIKLN